MARKYTNEEFIAKANNTHKGKYDYSKTDVYNLDHKKRVVITCPIHGDFKSTIGNHLKGKGCSKCNGGVKIDTKEFVLRAKLVHGNRYGYSKTNYVNSKTILCITCPIHGEFWQLPTNHLKGKGCSKCNGGVKMSNSEFINRAVKIHGNKYDYSKTNVDERDGKKRVRIICPKHGEFYQNTTLHLLGAGCPKCYGNALKTTQEFIDDANKVHNFKYDYSLTKYISTSQYVTIICPKHGEFKQTPNSHLQGHGCPRCATKSHLEDELKLFFTQQNIEFEPQKKFTWLGRQSLDFYLPQYNVAVECQGKQHFIATNSGWNNGNFLKIIQNLDERKRELCELNDVNLLYYSNLGIEYPYVVFEDKELLLKEIFNYAKKN